MGGEANLEYFKVGGAHIWIFRKVQLKSAKTKRTDAGE